MSSFQSETFLEVRGLSAVFPGERGGLQALAELSFTVGFQEFVCILGPSGCGKSTLLRILAGLLPPSQGQVLLKGQPLETTRQRVGFVFQDANLMPWRSVLQNISLPLEVAGQERAQAEIQAQAMLALVGLQGFAEALPRDLSGGMAQRVAMARALALDPEFLLLDEPFGALDALTRERMGAELLELWQQRRKTVLMVTHDIAEALFLADRVLVLTPRPGTLSLELPVELPRPRLDKMRYTTAFGELAGQIKAAIG
jgi:NitT/TauT family transport system ATP-binding protein